VLSERSPSTSVSRVLKQYSLSARNTGDFEFDVELLISVVEARAVLWDKTYDIYKDRIERKNTWREVCICLQGDFEASEDAKKKKTLLLSTAIIQ
jgi:hypothetical protein